ncbi:PucR family transcriptional regulator [Leucobacter sp. GX24907]
MAQDQIVPFPVHGASTEHDPAAEIGSELATAPGPGPAPTRPEPTVPGQHPTIELGSLLREYHLGLVLVAGLADDVAERPVRWVHVSELEDPTPFLTPRTVLLTSGVRLAWEDTQETFDTYVQRLVDAGTTALGIAIGLQWERVPQQLISACDRLGLPLFRVSYDTSFISIVQTAARLIDALVHARDAWSLASQRAVTNASLQHGGLAAALREAAHRLGRWVAVTDRSGRIIEIEPNSARGTVGADRVRREARRLIERGARSGRIGARTTASRTPSDTPTSSTAEDASGLQMHVLGRHGQILGVLVVEDAGTPDNAERLLLGLLTALATVQLEHRTGIADSEAALRSAVLRLLLAGETDLAHDVSIGVLERLPTNPLVAARYDPTSDPLFGEDLHSFEAGSTGLIVATLDDRPVIVGEARNIPTIQRIMQNHGVPMGISERGGMGRLAELLEQADRALDHARKSEHATTVHYAPALHDGVLRLLDDLPQARRRAEGLLAPLTQHDLRHDDRIEESVRAWLAHHGQLSPAATEIGVHRHTLKSRIRTAGALLQRDLDSPDARAELWAALRLTDRV